jgi:adenine deaminase
MDRRMLVDIALGDKPANLVLQGGTVVNVHTGESYLADVAIAGEYIAIVGEVTRAIGPETRIVDASGCFLTPGLIDAHLHTYETHLTVSHLAPAMLRRGVTTIATDFYGEAVVAGNDAVRASLDLAEKTDLNVLFTLPMPAYYQDRPFVHTGSLDEDDMREMLGWNRCIAVNECFAPYVSARDPFLMELMERARTLGKSLCGHASETTGDRLAAWVAFGGYLDDHECVRPNEVVEKARLGVRIVLREGSGASDVRNCLPAITEHGLDPRRFSFCSDLLSPVDLVREGNIDRCIRFAMQAGVAPIDAIRMGSLNAAETLGMDHWLGAIAPGKRADICLLRDKLENLNITDVIAGGRIAVREGAYVGPEPLLDYPENAWGTVRLGHAPTPEAFRVASSRADRTLARVIDVRDGTLITTESRLELEVQDGEIQADPSRDIAKIASFERHGRTGRVGLGFVRGFDLRDGAIASTYNPHCQHLLVVGTNSADMALAASEVHEMGGGFTVVGSGKTLARVPLPIYGLLSDKGPDELVEEIDRAIAAARKLGCSLSAPFHTLAFVGLPVIIGELKICSEGLIDVWAGEVAPVEVEA